MPSDSPRISVVIAAYDAADTLAEQLEALTATAPEGGWEILVCDNGSTDATGELVREWQGRHPGIRLVDASARRGPAAARNIGARHARAPLLAFCDADDRVADGWMAGMQDALTAHEFVAGSFEFALLNEGIETPGLWEAQSTGLTRKSFLPEHVVAGAGNMGIRAALFAEVGGFYEGLRTGEDDDLCLRVQLAGHELVFVPGLLLHVRRRGGLRDLARQAYSYAAGERRLAYRYAGFAERRGAPIEDPAADPPAEAAAGGRGRRALASARRALRKAVRIRRPADLAAVVWRWSWRLGWNRTTEDPAIPRIDPDDPAALRVAAEG